MDNKFVFDDAEELVTYMWDKIVDTNEPVTVIADKDTIVNVMNDLLTYEDVVLKDCDINIEYNREYFVSLYREDEGGWGIYVHPAYNDENNRYYGKSGYVLFHEDINSKALVDMQNNDVAKMSGHDWFIIGEDDSFESDGDEENNQEEPEDEEYSQDSGKDSNAEYTVTVKCNVDPGDVVGLVRDVERSVLHMYEMFDEMDNFRRLLGW